MNETDLSKYVPKLKEHGLDNSLLWEIHKKVLPYQCDSKPCDLRFPEKVFIICADPDTLLNKRNK